MMQYKAAPFGHSTNDYAYESADKAAEQIDAPTVKMVDSNDRVVLVMEEGADDEGFGTFSLTDADDIAEANRRFANDAAVSATDDHEPRNVLVAHGATIAAPLREDGYEVGVADKVGAVRGVFAPIGSDGAREIHKRYDFENDWVYDLSDPNCPLTIVEEVQ